MLGTKKKTAEKQQKIAATSAVNMRVESSMSSAVYKYLNELTGRAAVMIIKVTISRYGEWRTFV